ncbi:unnamed protein product [Pedinophyceae sp. YPF-701]|nr:unnamed protein product [Pedinophyceae sp. YPF-701]
MTFGDMAATQRAARRRHKKELADAAAAIESRDGTDAHCARGAAGMNEEERLRYNEEMGYQMEPFNLDQENREGRFDEDGHYVPHSLDQILEDPDAWLQQITDATPTATLATAAPAQPRPPPAPAPPPRTTDAHAEIDDVPGALSQVADMLQHPQETVFEGLRRIGGRRGSAPASSWVTSDALPAFHRLTDLSSGLLAAGEVGIYSLDKAALQRRAERLRNASFTHHDTGGASLPRDEGGEEMEERMHGGGGGTEQGALDPMRQLELALEGGKNTPS